MSRNSARRVIDTCKAHPLFEALNKDETSRIMKTEKGIRRHVPHFVCFLGAHGESGNNTNCINTHMQGCGVFENMLDVCSQEIVDVTREKYTC